MIISLATLSVTCPLVEKWSTHRQWGRVRVESQKPPTQARSQFSWCPLSPRVLVQPLGKPTEAEWGCHLPSITQPCHFFLPSYPLNSEPAYLAPMHLGKLPRNLSLSLGLFWKKYLFIYLLVIGHIRRGGNNTQKSCTKKIFMTWIIMMVWSLT